MSLNSRFVGGSIRAYRTLAITVSSLLLFSLASYALAAYPGTPFNSGDTLDPSCAPGSANCYVSGTPDQTGQAGKFLTSDGTTTSWAAISGGGTIGGAIAGGTAGGILFADSSGNLAQDATGLFYDGTTHRIGIGDATPVAALTVGSGDLFQVTSGGAIAAATGITSSGTITFSGLSSGIAHASAGGVLSSSLVIDADISPTAAISYSKLSLSNSIVAADLTTGAVTSTKILDGTIADADINAAAAIALSKLASGSSIVTSLTTPSGSNANGGSIASNVLTLSLADATNPGLVSTGAQTFAGVKTFTSAPVFAGTPTYSAFTTNGGLLYTNGSGVVAQTGAGTATTILHGGTTPTYSAVSLTADVTGTLPVANGGTGATTLTGILLGNGTSAVTALTTSAGISGALSDETGSGALVFGTTPTFTTSITDPLVIGGTTTTSPLTLRSTSGAGTAGADIIFQTGTNGATEAARILNSGNFGVGDSTPAALFTVGNGDLFQVNSSGAIAAATGVTSSGTITFSGFTTNGGLLYTNATGTLAQTGAGTATTILHGGTNPSYSAVDLTADVTGVLPVANGGTNISSYTIGDLLYGGGATTISKLGIGLNGYALVSNGTTPSWVAPSSLGSITVAAGTGGTDVNINTPTIAFGGTVTINIPTASATNRGALSSADWTTFNNKLDTPAGTTAQYVRGNGTLATLDTSVVPENGSLYFTNARSIASNLTGFTSGAGVISAADTVLSAVQKLDANITAATHNPVTIGTANGLSVAAGQVLSLGTATAAVTGALTSADWNTFNNKLTSSLASGSIFVGNAGGTATAAALSGDATLSNAGVLTLGTGAVTSTKILDGTIADADINAAAAIAYSKLSLSNSIVAADLTTGAVTSTKILDGTIADADINAAAAIALSKLASGSSIVTSLTTPSGSNANGGSIASNVLTLSLADATNPGLVSTGAQTFAGVKTFTSAPVFAGTPTYSAFTTNGGLLYTNGSGVVAQTGAGTATTILHGGTTPTYSAVDLTVDVTGALPVGNGGTGLVAYTAGDITYATAPTTLAQLGIGASGKILTSSGTAPQWSTAASLGSITVATGTSGVDFNVSGSPVSLGGTVTLNIPDAGAAARGVVTTGAQTFAGVKTFSSAPVFSVTPTISSFGTAGIVHNSAAGVLSSSLIQNADIGAAAAIAYSKLVLTNSIVAGDITSGAITTSAVAAGAIDGTKIGLASQTAGDLMYFDGTNWVHFATGTAGQLLGSTGTAPVWTTETASNGLTRTGSDVALGGTLTSSTTIANGGNTFAITGTGAINFGADATSKTITIGSSTGASGLVLNAGTAGVTGNIIDTDGTLAANSDIKLASQKAVKSYVDNFLNGLSWRQAAMLMDSSATNVATQIIGQSSYTADGVALSNGDRLLITGETTSPGTYKNRVFLVGGVGSAITLTLQTDGQAGTGAPTISDSLFVQMGSSHGAKNFVYDGTNWVLAAAVNGALVATNNLSDLSNVAAARANLGLGSTDNATFTTLNLSGFNTNGGILYTNGSGTLAQSAAGTATQILHGGTTPTYSAVDLTADVTGTLPVANGGTGLTSYTAGDISYATGATTLAKLGIGASGTVLTSNGSVPTWSAASGLGSITVATGTSGADFNVSGSPVSLGGTVTLNIPDAGAAARGVVTTGAQTFAGVKTFSSAPAISAFSTNGGLLYTNGSGVLAQSGAGTATTILHGGTTPSYSAVDLTADVTGTLPVANGGTGTTTAFTTGSALFAGAGGAYSQDNANFFWDNTNKRLGIGTSSPTSIMHIVKNQNASTNFELDNSTSGSSASVDMHWHSSTWQGAIGLFSPTTNTYLGILPADTFYHYTDAPNGQLIWSEFATGTIRFATGGANERMIINASGNVGIGDSSPTALLTVGSGDLFQVNSSGAIAAATGINSSGTITLSGFSTNGGLLYTNGSGVVAQTGAGTATTILHGGTTPSYSAVSLTADVTGTLPVANGGTGLATYTAGDIMYATGPTTLVKLGIGANGTILTSNGSVPGWAAGSGAGSISVAIGTSGADVNTSGSPVSLGGTLTLNIPDAATATRGALTAADWNTFNNKLTSSLASGSIFVGSAGGVATANALSGDATLSNAGVLTLGTGAVTSTKILDGTIADADINAAAAIALSKLASGSSIVTSLTTPSGSNANGGSIASNVLTLSLADATNPGLVSTGAQTFAGVKTFTSAPVFAGTPTYSAFTTNGGLLYTNGSGVVAQTGAGTATTILHGGTTPTYSAVSLTADVSGILPVTNGGTGTSTAFTTGSALFAGAGGAYTEDNSNFFWDNTNKRLGVGTSSPSTMIHVNKSQNADTDIKIENDTSGSAASANLILQNGSWVASLGLQSPLTNTYLGILPANTYYHYTDAPNGQLIWSEFATGTIRFATGGNFERMIIDASGNVGIGTMTPSSMFAVGATSQFQVSSSGAIAAATGITSSGTITLSGFSTNGGLLYTNGSGVVAQSGAGTATTILHGGTTPSYSAVSLTADVTGVLPVANGGTGTTTSLTTGSVVFAGATGAYTQDNTNFFFDDTNNRLGLGTATPRTTLELAGDGAILASGTLGAGFTEPSIGAGTRMLFYPRKAAFRAGNVNGTQWDNASIGNYSTALGRNTTASASQSSAFGFGSTASAQTAVAFGFSTSASGQISTSFGSLTTASGTRSFAAGLSSIASGQEAVAFGVNTTAASFNEFTLGSYNTSYTPVTTTGWDSTDRLFGVGDGVTGNPSDALVILKGGNTGIGTATPRTALEVYGTAGGVNDGAILATGTFGSGFTEPNLGAGTRMLFYPQKAAFRVGNVTGTLWDNANIGNYSIALGQDTRASGVNSVAFGKSTQATGFLSTAFGNSTTAFGPGSIAFGNSSIAVGQTSTVFGNATRADGAGATAFGWHTYAPSYAETAIGVYNTQYTPNNANAWDTADRLFTVGNGTGVGSESDAFTILKDGTIGISNSTPGFLLDVGSSAITAGTTVARFEDAGGTCDVTPTTAGGISCTSDARLKENVNDYNSGLAAINALRPVTYSLIADPNHTIQPGFIAQELETVLPTLVRTDSRGYKSLSYAGLTPVLAQAIKELDVKIEPLTSLDVNQDHSLASLIRDYLESATNGIRKIFVGEVHTDKLCVGQTCLDENQIKAIMQNMNAQSGTTGGVGSSTGSGTSGDTTGATSGSTGSTTSGGDTPATTTGSDATGSTSAGDTGAGSTGVTDGGTGTDTGTGSN